MTEPMKAMGMQGLPVAVTNAVGDKRKREGNEEDEKLSCERADVHHRTAGAAAAAAATTMAGTAVDKDEKFLPRVRQEEAASPGLS